MVMIMMIALSLRSGFGSVGSVDDGQGFGFWVSATS